MKFLSRSLLVLGLSLLSLSLASSGERKEFFFKDGDRIVVMGDSITEQHLYSNYLELWTVTRFPQWKLTFRNVGIGGDRSVGGNSRFKRDVLAHNATALTVDFGMNDGGYQPFNEKLFAPYVKGLQGIADQAKAAKVRVAWITPQPIEHNPGDKKESYNETLEKFSEGVKSIALKNEGHFVDQFHPYWDVIRKARESGEKGRITGGDAVHPGPAGQVVMAASILRGLNFPALVSSVEIQNGKATAQNAEVTDLKASPEGVTFKRLDRALPFFPAEAKTILKWSPVLEEMNQYGLKVGGLKPGKYEVRIDGVSVTVLDAEQLAKGVNLAQAVLEKGPIAEHVGRVSKAVQAKNRYFHDEIFRGVLLANAKSPAFKGVEPKNIDAKRVELYEERMKRMPELDNAVREALRLQPHTFEIRPVAK